MLNRNRISSPGDNIERMIKPFKEQPVKTGYSSKSHVYYYYIWLMPIRHSHSLFIPLFFLLIIFFFKIDSNNENNDDIFFIFRRSAIRARAIFEKRIFRNGN